MSELPYCKAASRRLLLRIGLAGIALAATGALAAPSEKPLRIGTGGGPLAEILNFAVARAKEKGVEVQVVEFTDWITPNEALAQGDIDANLFQHIPFMKAASKARGYRFAAVAPTYVMPVGLFSTKVKSFSEVPDGAWVAIANDPVNGARGLRLLDKAGLIKLRPGAGDDATVIDIVSNPKKLRFRELEAAQLPRSLEDVALAQVSISYLMMSGGDPERALLADGFGDDHYALQFVARAGDKDDPRLARFVEIYRSPEVKAFIEKKYGRYFVPVW